MDPCFQLVGSFWGDYEARMKGSTLVIFQGDPQPKAGRATPVSHGLMDIHPDHPLNWVFSLAPLITDPPDPFVSLGLGGGDQDHGAIWLFQ